MSHFSFVTNQVLRSHLDRSFAHVTDLLSLSESELYKERPLLVSSLRKTIIIHTASIIEALLLWRLRVQEKLGKISLADEWKYFDVKIIHRLDSQTQVIAGKRRAQTKDLGKIDFFRIIDLCYLHKIIPTQSVKDDIDRVRMMRNQLHIGNLESEKDDYDREDLEFCFKVAKIVKQLVNYQTNNTKLSQGVEFQ